MAIMRTNRLTSKTTTPPKNGRKFVSSAELESQDAAYKKYQGDVEIYNSQMKQYEKPMERTYVAYKSNARRLNKDEETVFNAKLQKETPGSITYTNIQVPKNENFLKTKLFHGDMVKPVAPKKVNPADWSNVELNKMPTKKASISAKKGGLRQSAPADKPVFDAPTSASRMGTKRAMGTKGAEYGELKRAKAGVIKTTSAGLNREKAQFEAFARSGGDQTKSMFKAEAKSSKAVGKQYKAEGNREGVQMMRQEAKQYKKAAQFAGKLSKGTNKYYERNMVSKYNASR